MVCTNLFCTDPIHINALNDYCTNILDCCLSAADTCIPLTGVGANRRIPGWSEHIQPYRDKAMFWHNVWMDMGRPHDGSVAQIRRSSRAKYHQAIRAAVRDENTLVKGRIARCMLNNRDRDFWKEIKRIRGRHKNVPTTIDDCNNGNSIVNLFASSYKHLYSSVVSNVDEMKAIRDHIENNLHTNSSINSAFIVSMIDVYDAINGLKSAKKDGENEKLTSDYFIHASRSLSIHIAMLISSLFNHGVVVNNMKVSTIKPIPKNVSNVCDSNNYRSIAIGSVLGKIVDSILLKRLSDYLITSELQFGFKPHHSTNMCTFLLKETISYYTRSDSSVYCVLLDAMKAFDRISYVKLFQKLIDRKLPAIVLRFLVNLYSEQRHVCSMGFQ